MLCCYIPPMSILSFPKMKTYVNDIFVRRLYVIFFIIRLNRILDGQLDVSKLCVKMTYTCSTFINCIEIFIKIPNKIKPFPSCAKIFQTFNKCQIWSLFVGVKINIFIHSVIPNIPNKHQIYGTKYEMYRSCNIIVLKPEKWCMAF